MAKRLTWFFVEAASQGITASLNELLECPDLPDSEDDPLSAIQKLCEEAAEHGVKLAPDPKVIRDFSTPIVLTRLPEGDQAEVGERIQTKYLSGEIPNVEYKSTLWLDIDRQKNDINATNDDLRAKKIANSSMKTICGFLNELGGELLIGVTDDGVVIGLENEFEVTCPTDQTLDGWLKTLRTTIEQFFYDPHDVINHLRIELGSIEDKTVCLITITPRRRLSVCKCKDQREFQIYSRKGTSTDIIQLTSAEDYILNRTQKQNATR